MSDDPRRLFLDEAVAHHVRGGARGDVLALTPRSFFWVHRVLVGLAVAAVVFVCVGQLDEYATGPAVVRVAGRSEVTAATVAVVDRIEVDAGDRVRVGDALVLFEAAAERAELASIERELADRLAAQLRDPADQGAREAVASLRMRRGLARVGLERKTLRAVQPGVVGDVRIRAGQLVDPGMPLLTLLGEQGGAEVTALLPGRYLPLLSRGQTLRLSLDGFEKEVHGLRIERVGDQIIGPTEAARYLGRELGDAFPIAGPVVLVYARLPGSAFRSSGKEYRYSHGMYGRAEAAVRTKSIVSTLLPELSGALFDEL